MTDTHLLVAVQALTVALKDLGDDVRAIRTRIEEASLVLPAELSSLEPPAEVDPLQARHDSFVARSRNL